MEALSGTVGLCRALSGTEQPLGHGARRLSERAAGRAELRAPGRRLQHRGQTPEGSARLGSTQPGLGEASLPSSRGLCSAA